MKMKPSQSPEQLAEAHAEWTAQLAKKIYYEAFLHGWKHSKEKEE